MLLAAPRVEERADPAGGDAVAVSAGGNIGMQLAAARVEERPELTGVDVLGATGNFGARSSGRGVGSVVGGAIAGAGSEVAIVVGAAFAANVVAGPAETPVGGLGCFARLMSATCSV